ncbi:MAG: hypothetical protein WCI41_02365 [bacterium]
MNKIAGFIIAVILFVVAMIYVYINYEHIIFYFICFSSLISFIFCLIAIKVKKTNFRGIGIIFAGTILGFLLCLATTFISKIIAEIMKSEFPFLEEGNLSYLLIIVGSIYGSFLVYLLQEDEK